jgi:hypothetical protein
MATSAALKPEPTPAPAKETPADDNQPAISFQDLPLDVRLAARQDEMARQQDEFDEKLAGEMLPGDPAIGKLLTKDDFHQPEHSKAYLAARGIVHGVAEKCDTTAGHVLQWAPPVKAACAAAETLDNLDNAYDSHLQGDSANVKRSLVQAGRSAVPGLDTAVTVIETAHGLLPAKSASQPEIAAAVDPVKQVEAAAAAESLAADPAPARATAPRGPSAGFMSFLAGRDSSTPDRTASPLKMR